MSSFERPVGGLTAVQRLFAALNARRDWEARNNQPLCVCHGQGLASAWTEAMGIDAALEQQREWETRKRGFAIDAAFLLSKHGVPARAAAALVKADTDRPGIRAVRNWLKPQQGDLLERIPFFLVLLGGPGTGKTVSAAFAAQLWLQRELLVASPSGTRREPLVWVAAAELANLSSYEAGDKQWIERMESCGLLVVDDLGAEGMHEHAQARLERLMDIRYSEYRPTLVTSNCSATTLRERIGARISDRIREAGRVVNCGNVSLRGVAK